MTNQMQDCIGIALVLAVIVAGICSIALTINYASKSYDANMFKHGHCWTNGKGWAPCNIPSVQLEKSE